MESYSAIKKNKIMSFGTFISFVSPIFFSNQAAVISSTGSQVALVAVT
jgi:hypothetical protein